MTITDKPQSGKQRYVIAEKGRQKIKRDEKIFFRETGMKWTCRRAGIKRSFIYT